MSRGIIYKIINKINGKFYLGSTIDKERRWKEHKKMLRGNYHHNIHLQNAWNKYGDNSFKFRVVEKVKDVDSLLDREDFYIKYIEHYVPETLYNIAKDVKAPMRGKEFSKEHKKKISEAKKGRRVSKKTRRKISESVSGENNPMYGEEHSEKTRKKMSEAQKGKEPSEEARRKMSEAHKGKEPSEETKEKLSKLMSGNNNHNYGKKIPEKTREKISKALKGREMSRETRKKMSEAHKGKEFSEKHKKNLSQAHKGENHPQSKLTRKKVKVILYLLDGDSFTHKEIGKMYGVSKSAISSIARGKNWTHVSVSQ